MTYPARANLLTWRDTPRNQGSYNRRCGSFGIRKDLEVMFDRSPTHAGVRLSADFLYWTGQELGGKVPADTGGNPQDYARALEFHGICLESEYSDGGNPSQKPPPEAYAAAKRMMPIRLVRMPYIEGDNDGLLSMRHWICNGYPLVAVVQVFEGMAQVSGPTSSHDWNSTGTPRDEHITCFVGYEPDHFIAADSGAGRYGNSEGHVGFRNEKLIAGPSRCVTSLWLIAECPVRPVPVEGYMPDLAKLTQAEMGPEVAFARAALKAAEESATEAKRAEWTERVLRHQPQGATGWQWAVDAFVKEGLTDRNADIVFRQVPGWFLNQCDALGLDSSKMAKDIG